MDHCACSYKQDSLPVQMHSTLGLMPKYHLVGLLQLCHWDHVLRITEDASQMPELSVVHETPQFCAILPRRIQVTHNTLFRINLLKNLRTFYKPSFSAAFGPFRCDNDSLLTNRHQTISFGAIFVCCSLKSNRFHAVWTSRVFSVLHHRCGEWDP